MKAHYSLIGFRHDLGFRVFTFETTEDHGRTAYVVRADLALARKHCVPIQELPLLCRALLLERRCQGDSARAYTFGETEMREYEDVCAARMAEAQKQRPPVRRAPA